MKDLEIYFCHSLSSLDGLNAPTLKRLWIDNCDNLPPLAAEEFIRWNRKSPFLAAVVLAERARAAEEAAAASARAEEHPGASTDGAEEVATRSRKRPRNDD